MEIKTNSKDKFYDLLDWDLGYFFISLTDIWDYRGRWRYIHAKFSPINQHVVSLLCCMCGKQQHLTCTRPPNNSRSCSFVVRRINYWWWNIDFRRSNLWPFQNHQNGLIFQWNFNASQCLCFECLIIGYMTYAVHSFIVGAPGNGGWYRITLDIGLYIRTGKSSWLFKSLSVPPTTWLLTTQPT